MTQTVNIVSIFGMVFSLLISVGLPFVLMALAKKKMKAKILPFWIGVGTFLVFALILEKTIFNYIIISTVGLEKLTSNLWIYALFGGLEAGIFEEVGRYISMKFLMKKDLNKENSIMFGIGHGGVEAIIIMGFSMISNLIVALMINSGTYDATLQLLDPATRAQTLARISVLWTTAPGLFFLGGFERGCAITCHICFSYVVYRSLKDRKPLLLLAAIGLHCFMDAGIVLLSSTVSEITTEIVFVIFTLVLGFFTLRSYKNENDSQIG